MTYKHTYFTSCPKSKIIFIFLKTKKLQKLLSIPFKILFILNASLHTAMGVLLVWKGDFYMNAFLDLPSFVVSNS